MADANGYLPVCPVETETNISYQEALSGDVDEIRAYKLGKRRWSYNQVELLLCERGGSRRSTVRQAVNMGTEDFEVGVKDSAVSFQVQLDHGYRLHLQAFLCFDTTEGMDTGSGGRGMTSLTQAAAEVPPNQAGCYQWVLVSRAACCKGCSGPVLRAIQRFGKLGKRTCSGAVTATEDSDRTRNNMKDPRFLYLSFDEATTHVAAKCFRLIIAAFDNSGQRLLGTAVSPPVRVLANNDVPTGAAHIQMVMEIGSWWEGWTNAAVAPPLQFPLPSPPQGAYVRLQAATPPSPPAALTSRKMPQRTNRGRNKRLTGDDSDYSPEGSPEPATAAFRDVGRGRTQHVVNGGGGDGGARNADPSSALGRARRAIEQYDTVQAEQQYGGARATAVAAPPQQWDGYPLARDQMLGMGMFEASKRQRFGGAPFAADPYPHMAHHPLELDPPMPGMLLPGGQLDNAAAYLDLMQHLPPGLPDTSGLPSAPVLAMAAAGGQVQQLAGLVGGGTPFEHDPIAAFADYMIHLQQQATQGSAMHAATTLPPSLRSQPIAPQQASASMHGALLNAQQHAQLAKLQRMRDDPDGFHGTPPLSSKPLFTGGGGGGGGSGGGNGGLARLSSLDKSGAQGGSMGGTGAGAYSSLHGCRDFSPLRLPNTPPSLSTPTPSALDDLFCSIQPTLESAAEVFMNQGESRFGGPTSSDCALPMAGML